MLGGWKERKCEIQWLLDEMPEAFQKEGKGGHSFLALCEDKHGVHWAEHRTMDALITLGLATNMAAYCMPREMWKMLPGSVPYVVFDTEGMG